MIFVPLYEGEKGTSFDRYYPSMIVFEMEMRNDDASIRFGNTVLSIIDMYHRSATPAEHFHRIGTKFPIRRRNPPDRTKHKASSAGRILHEQEDLSSNITA